MSEQVSKPVRPSRPIRGRAKTILIACSDATSLRNFRGPLICDLITAGHKIVAVAPVFPREIAQWCEQMQISTECTALNNQSLNPVKDLVAIAQLWCIIRRHRPDVVMGYTHKPALYTALLARLARVPKVTMMVTGLGFGFNPGPSLRHKIVPAITHALFRLGCASCDTVIFHNQDNRDFFLSHGLLRNPAKAVVVRGSGVDLQHYRPQPLERSVPCESAFLLIARLVRYKGILEYARAAEALRRRWPKARFFLAGYRDRNPLGYSDEEWAFIMAHLEYLGSAKDVRPLYARCHVYVLPSYGEGMPRTILEAMATGRAIVTTDTFGCRDTVDEGVNGFLVPVQQWEPLANAMEQFLSGQSSYVEMARESVARAQRLFDVRKVNRDMMKALGLKES